MKKAMASSALGLILGLFLVVAPLLALAEIKGQYPSASPNSFSEKFIEGSTSDLPRFTSSDIWVLAICFAIAMAAYLFLRSRLPEREYRMVNHIPY